MVMTHNGYDGQIVGHIISQYEQKGAFNFTKTEHYHE